MGVESAERNKGGIKGSERKGKRKGKGRKGMVKVKERETCKSFIFEQSNSNHAT